MSKIVPQYDLTKVTDSGQFMRFCSTVVGQVVSALNGNLDFTNLSTQQVNASFISANSNVAIPHNLGKTGVNYIVVSKDAACDIYRGSGDTSSQIFLKSTAGGVSVTLILY